MHLLRELEKVDLHNDSAEWRVFAKNLRRLLRDGIRLRKRPDFSPGKFPSRVDRVNARLAKLAAEEHLDGDTRCLTRRLRKYAEFIFTFLDYADVAFGRIEMWRGGLGWAYPLPPLSSGGASIARPYSVSTSRSSNGACGFPAHRSRMGHHAFALGGLTRRATGLKRPSFS